MIDSSHKDIFSQSLERCAKSENFIPAFYEKFLATSEEIANKFQSTNFELQNQMLLQSLRLSASASAGDPDSLKELRARAESHNRYHLNIKPGLYDDWLKAAIETAEVFDEAWDLDIKEAWEVILGYVVKRMIKFY